MTIKVVYSLECDVQSYLNSLYNFKWLSYGRKDIKDRLFSSLPSEFRNALNKAVNVDNAKRIIKGSLLENLEGRKVKSKVVNENLESA